MATAAAPDGAWPGSLALDEPCLDMLSACSRRGPHGRPVGGGGVEDRGGVPYNSTTECSVYDRFDDAFGISGSGSLGIRGSWTDRGGRRANAASTGGALEATAWEAVLQPEASAGSGRSVGSAPAEAPGIPAPAVSAGERKGRTRASRRAALVRNLVARAMVHNNEARELLAGAEGSSPVPLQVSECSEGSERAEAEPAEATGKEVKPHCPSNPPRRDPSAGGTGTPWIGLGEDGRDPPEEKDGGQYPAPGAEGETVGSHQASVLFRPRDPLALPRGWARQPGPVPRRRRGGNPV
ncbi:hypothetical protein THAOC_33952 [Thalassiosira oceanica]|uniref:Uncharacterized protein n=1 Tax=Thalassiosira oceanica TaxID=159749 RepID=K0RE50_THAOC|nr:hypothetical protein THAOC_33952 [Thalassiosira oceanica]|eukprot:EJK47336.1 hypothetical protein THAOC_33952 [Thalassiosira oceanica]